MCIVESLFCLICRPNECLLFPQVVVKTSAPCVQQKLKTQQSLPSLGKLSLQSHGDVSDRAKVEQRRVAPYSPGWPTRTGTSGLQLT